MRGRGIFATCLYAFGLAIAGADSTTPSRLAPVRSFTVEGTFETHDGMPPARDLSGIACRPTSDGLAGRVCLVINEHTPQALFLLFRPKVRAIRRGQ